MQKLASAERGLQTASSDFLEAVLEGLSLPQKALPSRFFYDEAGSALFERITALPEYYPTRTEIALLNSYRRRDRRERSVRALRSWNSAPAPAARPGCC